MSGTVASTQWSRVVAARDGTDTEARAALEFLIQTYWEPLYGYRRNFLSHQRDHQSAIKRGGATFTDSLDIEGGERHYLTSREPQTPYREMAEELGMNEVSVRVAVHRLRKQYGNCLRAEIADTVADPADIDDEVRHSLTSLRPKPATGM